MKTYLLQMFSKNLCVTQRNSALHAADVPQPCSLCNDARCAVASGFDCAEKTAHGVPCAVESITQITITSAPVSQV